MCGIVCAFETKAKKNIRSKVLEMSKKIRHRGPDWSGIFSNDSAILSHERLSIVDPSSGKQPLYSKDNRYVLAANGEIYNHQELRKEFPNYEFSTKSDCEVILALYIKYGPDFIDKMNGIFAFVIYDSTNDEYFVARDHMGIIPLYIGWDSDKIFYVSSELKALEGVCNKIELFPPGHYFLSSNDDYVKWYDRDWREYDEVKNAKSEIKILRDSLEQAVRRQLMSDVPYGVLLSGGLDSSITSAVAKKYSEMRIESNDKQPAWWPQDRKSVV